MCRSRMKTRSDSSTISIVIVTPETGQGGVKKKKNQRGRGMQEVEEGGDGCVVMRKDLETNQSLPECRSDMCGVEDRKDSCKLSPCLSGSAGDPARLLSCGFHRARVVFLLASAERPDVCLFCHIVRVYV